MQFEQQTWGVEINRTSFDSPAIPKLCQEWVTPSDKSEWGKRGVIVWCHQAQRVERLSAVYALKFLEHMRTDSDWRASGITILRHSVKDVNNRTDKGELHQDKNRDPNEGDSKPETTVEERFRLSPDQSAECFRVLEANEKALMRMFQEDEWEYLSVWGEIAMILADAGQHLDANKFDLSARPLPWVRVANKKSWICDCASTRGSVFSTENNLSWQASLERPGRKKQLSPTFTELEEAFIWAEQRLEAEKQKSNEPQEVKWQEISIDELIAQKREQLAEYWIDPAAMDSERITYQAIIDLDYMPYDYKSKDLASGEQRRHAEKYASPAQLGDELRLSPQLDIEQIDGFFSVTSRVTYFQRDVAMTQAQRFWDQSTIVPQHRAGKVIRAQYGIKEVETGYKIIMGICENPDQPYPVPHSREEYLARKAFIATLEYALDLEGYRAYLEFRPNDTTDKMLLEMMHRHRAQSSLIPIEAQLESERWLRENNVK